MRTITYHISISENGTWAGDGKYSHSVKTNSNGSVNAISGSIFDCPASIPDGAYEAIENTLAEMEYPEVDGGIEFSGKAYGWVLE